MEPARPEQAPAIERLRNAALRHSGTVAVTVLALTLAATMAALVFQTTMHPDDRVTGAGLVTTVCQLLPYGTVGAVLVARRPDLPFGWVLSLAALSLVVVIAVAVPSFYAFDTGHGSQLALWGVGFASLAWVPAALEGVINVRFPSGSPTGRVGRLLDRVLCWGIPVVVVAGLVSDWPEHQRFFRGPSRFIDSTPLPTIADWFTVGIPLLILVGVLAGIGVVVRYFRSSGLERQQLRWRAGGVVVALTLFPFVVTEVTPDWIDDVTPFVFVATLVIPVLRYDLWAVDSIIRRSTTYTMSAPGSVLSNVVRASAEMLRLPYLAVCRSGVVLASYGEPVDVVRRWPLVHAGERVGDLVAAPRYGHDTVDAQDAEVLTTVATLVGGMVRAESLTRDLQDARQRLVSAREEERRRLRRDLHDGLGPLLTGLGLNLDAAAAHLGVDDGRSATYLGNAQQASGEVISSLREVVYGLRPPALDDLGFADALRLQLQRITTDAGIGLDLAVSDGLVLPAAVEVAAFRTALEAVTNVARHSRARRVVVNVEQTDGCLTVTVTDDGPPTPAWRYGVGLSGMRERAEEVGGAMDAGPTGSGGRVHVSFPTGKVSP